MWNHPTNEGGLSIVQGDKHLYLLGIHKYASSNPSTLKTLFN